MHLEVEIYFQMAKLVSFASSVVIVVDSHHLVGWSPQSDFPSGSVKNNKRIFSNSELQQICELTSFRNTE
jgi:hypothetical protein